MPIGSVVCPYTSFGITRNYDYFHAETTAEERASGKIEPYTITKALNCDREVHDALYKALQDTTPKAHPDFFDNKPPQALPNIVNASADSFYGSQGREDAAFLDANANLIEVLQQRHPGISTLEMETFVLNHLAMCAAVSPEAPKIRTGAVQMM